MSEAPNPDREPDARGESRPVRWHNLFQRCGDPVFLLSPGRRLWFANRAFEELTGRPAGEARGLACRRHRDPEAGSWEELAHFLHAPPEVLAGRPARVRRLLPGRDGERRWCDLDFLPLRDGGALAAVLGRITASAPAAAATGPLPPELVGLREAHAQRYRLEDLAGTSPPGSAALRRVLDQARLASQTRAPVLILGEPGAGKEWLARAIHYRGAAREAAFVALDCASLPPGAVAALVFGDGGLARRPGVGTLYLREPARLPRDLQDRLCALVAESGARGPRVITGAAHDLAPDVRDGRLRDDLFFALATLVVELPPLRDRPAADLPWLVGRLLRRAAGDGPGPAPELTPEAWELVYAYPWPGNLAELYTVLAGAWARAQAGPDSRRVGAADLPAYLRLARAPAADPGRPLPLDRLLEQAERRLILLALRRARGNRTRAAEILGVWRPRLLRRLEGLGIEGEKSEARSQKSEEEDT